MRIGTRQRTLRRLDERLQFADVGRTALSKVFPDHWSFMLGEIALYSFILLVATGIYLALFFDPSTADMVYHGRYVPMRGVPSSAAFTSTVRLSWDVRGGLLMRQAHHWAAHIFIGAIVVHLCRIFFTGMFRRPREINWLVGVTLLALALLNAFFGYSLPDDLLSGTGLHIFWSVMLSMPVIGPWLAFLMFDGNFPGQSVILHMFTLHILVVPLLIAVLITVHLAIIVRQKHSHFAGPGRSDVNVVGSRMWPAYALRSLALLFAVSAVTFLLGGLAQINPIWVWGDFTPASILSPSVADWYVAWIEGGLRLFPPGEFTIFGHLVPNQFWAGIVLPLVTFGLLYAWPLIDRVITGDRGTHHLTGRPRDCPTRTAIGVAALFFYSTLLVASGDELLSEWTGWPVENIRVVLRGVVIGLPILAGVVTYVIAEALRRSEREGVLSLSGRDLTALRRPVRAAEDGAGENGAGERKLSEVPSWILSDEARREPEPTEAEPAAPTDGERQLSEAPSWLTRGGRRRVE